MNTVTLNETSKKVISFRDAPQGSLAQEKSGLIYMRTQYGIVNLNTGAEGKTNDIFWGSLKWIPWAEVTITADS